MYPGIADLLASLKAAGKTVVLSTSKPQDTATDILRLHGIYKYFDIISGHDYVNRLREKKCEVLEYALEKLGVEKNSKKRATCVLVGDRKFDAEGAAICGIASVGVAWGHATADELNSAGFTNTVKTVEELKNLLI